MVVYWGTVINDAFGEDYVCAGIVKNEDGGVGYSIENEPLASTKTYPRGSKITQTATAVIFTMEWAPLPAPMA